MITLRPGHLGGVAQRQQQAVVERGVVARHGFAKAENGVVAVVRERRGARKIAAEGVDRHGIRSVQAAHEIGDRVGSVNKSAIHVVAGIEEHEHVGADERVRADFGSRAIRRRGRSFRRRHQRARGSVVQHLHGRLVAFSEGVDLLRDAVFGQTKIAGLQAVDVVALAIGDREAQDHHVHFDAKGRPLFLGPQLEQIPPATCQHSAAPPATEAPMSTR